MDSEWSEEVLFPSANAIGYRLIFEAETWLRRICWTALMLSQGPSWAGSLDESFRKRLESQSANNRSRWYLGVDAEEELLWSTTHGQLASLLRRDVIQEQIHHLCGFYGELLASRLESVAMIRNTLAHSRAISDDSITILNADLSVIRAAVSRFKWSAVYTEGDLVSLDDDVPEDLFDFLFAFNERQNTLHGQQLFVEANADFVSLIRLPAPPWGYPDCAKFRRQLGEVAHLLVAVLANKEGSEFQLLMPRNLSTEDKIEVLYRFMNPDLLLHSWTELPFEKQPTPACWWPRLWFYENRYPAK
ncbi:hypothetical protein [Mycobacterium lehmannii]|nr:hypothetical protein [Mycobacterium lehmannii]